MICFIVFDDICFRIVICLQFLLDFHNIALHLFCNKCCYCMEQHKVHPLLLNINNIIHYTHNLYLLIQIPNINIIINNMDFFLLLNHIYPGHVTIFHALFHTWSSSCSFILFFSFLMF